MLIQNIRLNFNTCKLNFKGNIKNHRNPNYDSFEFDDDLKKFSAAQKNYYGIEIYKKYPEKSDKLQVVFPVNGDDESFINTKLSLLKKLKNNQVNLQMFNANYSIDGRICSDKGFTDGICDCITVLLYNNNIAHFYHLNTYEYQKSKDVKEMQQALKESIEDLQKNNQNCRCFLYGGEIDASFELYENICEVLDENNIERDEAVFNTTGGPYSIYFDINKGIILMDEVYAFHSKKQLEENFARVKISDYFYSEML